MVLRVAVVTGSNKGIGLAIVRALCKQFRGDVYLTARDVYVAHLVTPEPGWYVFAISWHDVTKMLLRMNLCWFYLCVFIYIHGNVLDCMIQKQPYRFAIYRGNTQCCFQNINLSLCRIPPLRVRSFLKRNILWVLLIRILRLHLCSIRSKTRSNDVGSGCHHRSVSFFFGFVAVVVDRKL